MKIRNSLSLKRAILKLNSVLSFKKATFRNIQKDHIYLYAGDVPKQAEYDKFIGLSISQNDSKHIKHDITKKHELPDNSVDIYQAEDVFEHIEFKKLNGIVNDIYRILKPKGIFRLSVPDYRCDILYQRSIKDSSGKILFDPLGGGHYKDGKVTDMGHLWFPQYESVKSLLEKSYFKTVVFYHYYNENGIGITNEIDYSVGFVQRTPDNDERVKNPYRPLSIVVDCIK